MKTLAICTPTYNEKENIENLISQVREVCLTTELNVSHIIIDDSSPDGTGEIVDKLVAKYNSYPYKVDVIHRESKTGQKLGLGTAYKAAFTKAVSEGFDYILTLDADLSHKPSYIPIFLKNIQSYDYVIGSRNIQGGGTENWSFLRKLISKAGSLVSRIILGVNINDFTGGYNMYRRETLEKLDIPGITAEGYLFQIEVKYKLAKLGFKYFEFPIIFPDRSSGKSKMDSKIAIEALLKLWKIRFSK